MPELGPAVSPVLVPLGQLRCADWNPRNIKDIRFQSLLRSIQADPAFLWRRPVLALADGTVYAGNMRLKAAEQLGLPAIPAIVEDVDERTAKERAIRDNNGWGDWVDQDVAEMLYQLQEAGSPIVDLGFNEVTVDRLLASVSGLDELLGMVDEAPAATGGDPVERWAVTYGQAWAIRSKTVPALQHRVVCASATSTAALGKLFDGIGRASCGVAEPPLQDVTDPTGSYPAFCADWFPLFRGQVDGPLLLHVKVGQLGLWYSQPQQPDWTIAYQRPSSATPNPMHGQSVWDPVLVWNPPAYEGGPDTVTLKAAAKAQEAVRGLTLAKELVGRFCPRAGSVFDPFVGAGATLFAAEALGRLCYGVEADPAELARLLDRCEAAGLHPEPLTP